MRGAGVGVGGGAAPADDALARVDLPAFGVSVCGFVALWFDIRGLGFGDRVCEGIHLHKRWK